MAGPTPTEGRRSPATQRAASGRRRGRSQLRGAPSLRSSARTEVAGPAPPCVGPARGAVAHPGSDAGIDEVAHEPLEVGGIGSVDPGEGAADDIVAGGAGA